MHKALKHYERLACLKMADQVIAKDKASDHPSFVSALWFMGKYTLSCCWLAFSLQWWRICLITWLGGLIRH